MEVKLDNVAACKKKLSITIPTEEIKAKMNERYGELEHEAQVPGFRPGRAPRRLVEKRFREAVLEEVRIKLVSEGLTKALEEQKLDVIGDPEVDADAIKMSDDEPMTFSVELEVRPEFELPDYVGIPIEVEQPSVTDADVAHALEHLRESHGKLDEVPAGEAAKANDIITGDLAIQAGDMMILDRPAVRLPVAAIAVEGIRLDNIPKLLTGAKAGDTKTDKITIAQDHLREDLRGKEVEVRIKINEVRHVVLPDDAAVLKEADYESMDALKGALRRQLEGQSENTFRQSQEEAIRQWLLEHIQIELPDGLAKRHAASLLQRQLVNLQYRGVPVEEIETRLGEIQSATDERAAKDLKLFFILDKIAKKETVEATDAEVDARVRFIAAQYGRREDRLRDEMRSEGGLDNLRGQIREDKVMRLLVEKAKVTAIPPKAPSAEEKAEAAEKPAAKGKAKGKGRPKGAAEKGGETEST